MAKVVIEVDGKDNTGSMLTGISNRLEKIDQAGRQAMIGARSAAQGLQMIGGSNAFVKIAGEAGVAADVIGDLAGMLSAGMFNPWILGLTALGAVAGMVFTKMREEQERAAEVTRQQIEHYRDLHDAIQSLGRPQDDLAKKFQDQFNLSTKDATAMAERAKQSEHYRAIVDQRIAQDEVQTRVSNELAAAYKNLGLMRYTTPANEDEANALLAQEARVESLRAKLIELAQARQLNIDAMAKQAQLAGEDDRAAAITDNRQARLDSLTFATERYARQLKDRASLLEDIRNEAERTASALIKTQEAWAKARGDFARGLVEKAMTLTSVTDEDMRLTKLGLYKDKWDELRREAEDVDQHGEAMLAKYPKLAAALKETGLAAGEFAKQFKDFSLFADVKNIKFLDMSAISADVGQQLLGLAGKANAMEAAVKQAFSQMSDPQKAALAKIGIRSWGDAFKKLSPDAKDLQTEMERLSDRLGKLQDSETKIKIAKADDFEQVINEARDYLLGKIPKEMSTTIYVKYEIDQGNGDGGEGDGKGGKGGKGGAKPKGKNNSGSGFASGGMGVFERDQTVDVHRGEGYWFSGVNWNVPMPGAGDGGVRIEKMIVNSELDAERAAQRIARAMKKRR